MNQIEKKHWQDLNLRLNQYIKDKRGLDAYLVEINTETTTEADILNYTIRGNIKLVPTKSVEAFGIDFVLTNQGAAIS